jgi:integrase
VVLLPEPAPRVRWLTDAERQALAVELATPQREAFRRVVGAALLSGQRLGKIIALLQTDVDLAAGELTVRNQRKGGRVKTTHVPVSPDLAAVLTEAIAASDGSPYVFTTGRKRHGRRPYTRSGVSTFFARIAREAGLDDLHFHDLRHDFATRLKRGGSGLDVIADLLGHSSLAMTQRYAHIGQPEAARAVGNAEGLAAVKPKERTARKARRKKKTG